MSLAGLGRDVPTVASQRTDDAEREVVAGPAMSMRGSRVKRAKISNKGKWRRMRDQSRLKGDLGGRWPTRGVAVLCWVGGVASSIPEEGCGRYGRAHSCVAETVTRGGEILPTKCDKSCHARYCPYYLHGERYLMQQQHRRRRGNRYRRWSFAHSPPRLGCRMSNV